MRSPITAESLAISMITISMGGATRPLSTAVQNRASIGLTPIKLIAIPTRVEAAMRA
ncbi:hypothetical protein D3C87_2186810 [compost metagenome]